MDFWFFADCEPDGGCFFCEGRGVDISFPSTPRTIFVVSKGRVASECVEANHGRTGTQVALSKVAEAGATRSCANCGSLHFQDQPRLMGAYIRLCNT